MFPDGSVSVAEILCANQYPGAEYFNFFFTLVMVFGLIGFGLQLLFRIISRS